MSINAQLGVYWPLPLPVCHLNFSKPTLCKEEEENGDETQIDHCTKGQQRDGTKGDKCDKANFP